MANPLLPQDPKTRRKLLIYGGLAGALLLIVLLSRRGGDTAAPPAEEPLTAVGSPAVDSGLGGGFGSAVDNGAELAAFQTSLLDQLPDAVSSGVAAGLANGVPPPAASPGAVTINVGTGPTNKPSTGGPGTATIPHPAANRHNKWHTIHDGGPRDAVLARLAKVEGVTTAQLRKLNPNFPKRIPKGFRIRVR